MDHFIYAEELSCASCHPFDHFTQSTDKQKAKPNKTMAVTTLFLVQFNKYLMSTYHILPEKRGER